MQSILVGLTVKDLKLHLPSVVKLSKLLNYEILPDFHLSNLLTIFSITLLVQDLMLYWNVPSSWKMSLYILSSYTRAGRNSYTLFLHLALRIKCLQPRGLMLVGK